MELVLKRRFLGEDYTIGSLYVDNKYFCDTLEDTYRDLSKVQKISNKTAIPYGKYSIVLNVSPKFKRKLPRLVNVPYFEGILIHRGNTPEDTSGCILVGENKVKSKVINSTGYETKLVQLMEEAINKNEKITINII